MGSSHIHFQPRIRLALPAGNAFAAFLAPKICTALLSRVAVVLVVLATAASAQISVCPGSGWTTGSTHTAGTGTDRLLVVAVGGASSAQGVNDVAGVSYGSQSLTLIEKIESAAAGASYVGSLWFLNEAGIAAASNSTITLNTTGPGFLETSIAAATYCGVLQAAPITGSTSNQSSTIPVDPIAATRSMMSGNSSVAAAGCGNVGSFSWSADVAENTDMAGAVSTFSVADHGSYATVGNRTAIADFSGVVNHNVILFAELENAIPAPVADFVASPFTGPAPLNVSFSDLSTGTVSGWFWTFGDGTTSLLQNPTHLYTVPGLYTISLSSFGPGGSDLEIKTGILVTEQPPAADFSATPTSGLTPLSVSFTELTTGPVATFLWNFGDGGSSTLPNPTHTYMISGDYTVSLAATGPGGTDTETKVDYIMTADLVLANFAADVTFGGVPLTVNFTDMSVGPVTSWQWSFGDTNGSTLQDPATVYLNAGTYSVSLTVAGGGGMDSQVKTDYIVVIGPTEADFSGTPLSGTAPLTVTFTDLTTSAASAWSWSFGDGGSSTQQNPTHTYATVGDFAVSLTATGPGGVDVETKPDYVSTTPAGMAVFRNGSGVNPPCYSAGPPVLGATWVAQVDSRAYPNALLTVVLGRMDGIAGANTAWGELLVDPTGVLFDSLVVSGGGIDTHAFSLPNSPAFLGRTGSTQGWVLDVNGNGQLCNAADMLVGTALPASLADPSFSASTTGGAPPLLVSFTDESTGDVTSWSWDFGDGGTSTAQNPSYAYLGEGTYTVSLRVEGGGGFGTELKFDHIVVATPPTSEFIASPLSGNIPLTVNFSDLSTGTLTSWCWNFGDTVGSLNQNPSHTYTVPGTYTVSLTTTGPGGVDTETKPDYIVVGTLIPIAEFSATPLSGPAPLAVTFTDLTLGAVTSWTWNFGDGGSSSVQNPVHSYSALGTYTVSLTAGSIAGSNVNTKTDYITVVPPAPMADFSGMPLFGLQPLNVTFTDLTTGVVSAWDWDFGDAGVSTVQNPSHTYVNDGAYSVSLTATGPGGPDTRTKFGYVVVIPPPPVADFVGSPTSGEVALSVSFTDATSGSVSSWSWDFGDSGVSTLQNPSHTYTNPGMYTVSLTATGSGGAATETKLDYIMALAPQLEDGGFEMQTAGTPPSAPWIQTGGIGNVIHPDSAILTDNGMPLQGAQWAEISALGTAAAIPPSNPGGAGTSPVGAAGIRQTFGFVEASPVLVFSAAFLLGGAAAAAGANDFMSIDVSDGSTTHNIYYADTFSAFPNTSTRHTLPMTAVDTIATNLTLLFPSASNTTLLALSVQVGNGGDGQDPSLGYVDDFLLIPFASATYHNGSGINPPCYVADPPAIGSTWTAQLDHRDRPTITLALLLVRDSSVSTMTVFGELLAGGGTIIDFAVPAHPSGISTISLPLPLDFSLMGMGTSQGFLFGPNVAEETFCNAIDFELGFLPPTGRPAADFVASPVMGPTPLAVSYTDQTTGTATSWNWDFGDGATSTLQNPSHTYTSVGTYTVWIRATGPGGFDIERKFDHIQSQ